MDRNGAPETPAEGGGVASLDSRRVRSAFERLEAAQLQTWVPTYDSAALDPRARANRAAFLSLEDERRAVAVRLEGSDRRRGERYRDLVLITALSRLEHDHLVGGIGEELGVLSPADEPAALASGPPSEWAQPWATGPLLELRATYAGYRQARDRLGKRLLATTRKSAESEAEQRLRDLLLRFESLREDWSLALADGPVTEEWVVPRTGFRLNRVAIAAGVAAAVAAALVLV
jgi:hypothetical protein